MPSFSNRSSATASLTRGLVVTVILVTVASNLFFYFISAQQFQVDLQARASDSANELSGVLGVALWNFDEQTIERTASVYAGLQDVVRLRIVDTSDDAFFDYTSEGELAASAVQDIYFEDNLVGRVEIAFSSFTLQVAQNERLLSTALSTLLVVAAITIASQLLLRRFIQQPLEQMVSGLAVIGQGDYAHRLPLFQKTDLDTIVTRINDMSEQIALRDKALQDVVESLEERVVERTRDLAIAESIARQMTTELDQQTLLEQVAEITQPAFDLYQVNVYLMQEDGKTLKLAAASGLAGDAMLAMGKQHQIDGKGLVPTAAATRRPAVSNDVTQSPDHLVNPLLPDTRAEVAIPILFGDTLYGVLDLQAEEAERFDMRAVELYSTFANQLAIALHNAVLFEEARASTARAEESDRVKSAFLASMSHELRTPLNAIINFSKFLRRGIPGPINEEQTNLITNIVDSGQHLLNLINDVLDMSKIESGALKLFIEPNTDLAEILQSAINYAQPTLAEKPVKIERMLPEALPQIAADRRRLLQVFLNIVSNACKFTDEGTVRVGAQVHADRVVVSVKDTGPGIAVEDAKHVFTAFKQTETGLRQGGGTGLGMPITMRLVEAHRGRLWFESEVGVGTTFYVELPLEAAESAKAA
jgi:signal transduction histidine kinase